MGELIGFSRSRMDKEFQFVPTTALGLSEPVVNLTAKRMLAAALQTINCIKFTTRDRQMPAITGRSYD